MKSFHIPRTALFFILFARQLLRYFTAPST